MKEQREIEYNDDDLDMYDEDDLQTAYFEGDEVKILKVCIRNKSKIALIETQLQERFEVYYELLDT